MVRTTLGGHLEHATAYLLASAVAALGYGRRRGYAPLGMIYCAYAAVLEIGQIWIPGRHSAMEDFIASSIGVLAGVCLVHFGVRHLSPQLHH
jgi:VanZ family protein